jgi:hypothetical protein
VATHAQGDDAYAATLFTYATQQVNYMLGDGGRSYVVGFGQQPPSTPFHKWCARCACVCMAPEAVPLLPC